MIKLHIRAKGKHFSSALCYRLRARISALELTDPGEAGLERATAESVPRALCGDVAPQALGSGSLAGSINPFRVNSCALGRHPESGCVRWVP